MGRVRRYKRIKAIDPLNPKTHGVVDFDLGKDINRAPSKKDIEAIPRSVQRLLEAKGALTASSGGGGGGAPKPKPAPQRLLAHVNPLPGESKGSFHRRVNAERSKQLAAIRAERLDAKTVSDKRSAYLQKKKEKKRTKGTGFNEPGYTAPDDGGSGDDDDDDVGGGSGGGSYGGGGAAAPAAGHKRPRGAADDDSDGGRPPAPKRPAVGGGGGAGRREVPDDFPTERVAFGERAMEPPRLTVAPRKSQKQKLREAARAAQKAAIAAGRTDGASDAALAAADAARAAMDATRSEEMKRAQMERYRASVQEAYAAMKRKRAEDRPLGGGSGGGGAGAGGSGGGMGMKKKKPAMPAGLLGARDF